MAGAQSSVTGTSVVVLQKENGDNVEDYKWTISLASIPRSGMVTLATPLFHTGVFSQPSWRSGFDSYLYSNKLIELEFPYPAPPAGRQDCEFRWTVDSAEILIGTSPVPLLTDQTSRWRPDYLALVRARLGVQSTDTKVTFHIKIVGKRLNPRPHVTRDGAPLHALISKYFNTPELSDVKIFCEEETFLCHKFVLSVGSPVFKAMFASDTKEAAKGEIVINDVPKATLRLMLTWMYGENISDEMKTLEEQLEVYKVADRYLLDALKESLVPDIVRCVTAETAFNIYVLGDTYTENRFNEKATHIMKKERSIVFVNDDVLQECCRRCPKLLQEILMTNN